MLHGSSDINSHVTQGCKKTLVLREVPEDGVKKMLVNKESLAACDIAVFVHDRLLKLHVIAARIIGEMSDDALCMINC